MVASIESMVQMDYSKRVMRDIRLNAQRDLRAYLWQTQTVSSTIH